MGKVFAGIDAKLARFLNAQRIFFVATAPSGREGHVNLSPKGHDSFRIMGDRTVAYLDLIGSGVETIAHLRQNGRITLMFCAFEGPPRIVRLQGQGRPIEPPDADFPVWRRRFPDQDAVRSVIVVDLDRVADSCGYGVPLLSYAGERSQMQAWADHQGPVGLERYLDQHNVSIDGLPGLATRG